MPMTSLWCFSIKRFGTQFAGAELFFSMKPFYPINRVLSAHRARHGRPFIHSPVRRLMGCQLGCGCAALGTLCLGGEISLAARLELVAKNPSLTTGFFDGDLHISDCRRKILPHLAFNFSGNVFSQQLG